LTEFKSFTWSLFQSFWTVALLAISWIPHFRKLFFSCSGRFASGLQFSLWFSAAFTSCDFLPASLSLRLSCSSFHPFPSKFTPAFFSSPA
jgi:hypothetical protein